MFNGQLNKHRMRQEIESQRYKGQTRKLDPAIKNSLTSPIFIKSPILNGRI